MYVSSYYCSVCILVYMCVLILLCMCPRTTAASALELSTHVQALVEDKEGLVAERAMLLRSAGITKPLRHSLNLHATH